MKFIKNFIKYLAVVSINSKFFIFLINKLFLSRLNKQTLLNPPINNESILSELHKIEPFTFIPNPGNCGDLLILQSTLDFFNENNIKYKLWDGKNSLSNIVYGGGGIWVSNYQDVWGTTFIPIFKQAKKILILPSSFYKCEELLEVLDERFIIFCREKNSYSYIKNHTTKCSVFLDHDMAFRLNSNVLKKKVASMDFKMIKALLYIIKLKRKDKMFFLRGDGESKLDLRERERGGDLSSYLISTFPTSDEAIFCTKLMLFAIAPYNIVITDRLHIAISSVLLGKNTQIIDNNYGKLSGVYEQTLVNFINARLIK